MRLVYLTAENSVRMYNWAFELQKRGHHIVLVSENPHSNPPPIPFQLIKLKFNNSFLKFWSNKKEIEKILNNFKADIVHAFYSTNYGLLASRQRVCPAVVTIGGSDLLIEPKRSRIFKWINSYVFKKAKIINPVSNHLKTILSDSYGIEEKVEVFPAGIDLDNFHPPDSRSEQPIQIISTRNFKPLYNQKLLMQAIPKIIENENLVNFILIGDGPERTSYQDQLKHYQQVKWFGWKPRDFIAAELKQAHIYLSCSISDGTSSSLLEAMASGVFPIVTDIPANRDWIEDGVNGYLVHVDDPDFLTRRIIDAIKKPDLRNTAQKINLKLVRAKANFHDIVTKLEDIYANVIK